MLNSRFAIADSLNLQHTEVCEGAAHLGQERTRVRDMPKQGERASTPDQAAWVVDPEEPIPDAKFGAIGMLVQ